MSKKLNWPHLVLVFALSVVAAMAIMRFYPSTTTSEAWLGFAVFVTGVVGVYLVAVEHIINWPVGLLNVAIWGWICYTGHLFADMSLQIFFFVLGVQGWYFWAKGSEQHSQLKISRVPPRGWLLIAVALVLGVSIYVPIITHFKADWIWIDSILTVTSIIAQVLVNMKKIENWILWIVVNMAYIPVYKAKGYYSLVYLSAILLVLAIIGLIGWIKTYRDQKPVIDDTMETIYPRV